MVREEALEETEQGVERVQWSEHAIRKMTRSIWWCVERAHFECRLWLKVKTQPNRLGQLALFVFWVDKSDLA